MDEKNKLYFRDNLKILRDYVEEASLDLIYLDPPFNSSAKYNAVFEKDVAQGPLSGPAAFQAAHARIKPGITATGKESTGQIITFEDTSVAPLYERRRRRSQTGATAAAGFYEPKEFPGRYPRLQILTIAELLAGKRLEYPAQRDETFAKAERKTKTEQERLF